MSTTAPTTDPVATINVVTGELSIAWDDTSDAHAATLTDPATGGLITGFWVEPWGEQEEDLTRADAALAGEGLVRTGEWVSFGETHSAPITRLP